MRHHEGEAVEFTRLNVDKVLKLLSEHPQADSYDEVILWEPTKARLELDTNAGGSPTVGTDRPAEAKKKLPLLIERYLARVQDAHTHS